MTETATPSVPTDEHGNRARATERPTRCMAPKVESGKPCKREAGSGTDHPGEGPCALHDDGTWQTERIPFAEDEEAQDAFLAAVTEARQTGQTCGTRELIEALGFHKRDVTRLAQTDEDFRDRFIEARGFDPETIRIEVERRAVHGASDPLLKFWAEMNLPEAQVLRQRRVEGQVDVRAVPYVDLSDLSVTEIREVRQAQLAACSSEAELVRAVIGWINPSREKVPDEGQPVLELVSDIAKP